MKLIVFTAISTLPNVHAAFFVPLHAQRHPTSLGYQIGDENVQNIVEDFKMPTKASDTSPYTYFPVYSKNEKSKFETKGKDDSRAQIANEWSKEVPLKLVPKRRGDKDTTIKVNSQVKLADPNVPLYLPLNSVDEYDNSSNVFNPLYFADVVDVGKTESKMIKSPRSNSVNTYLDTLSRNELNHVSTPVTNYLDSLSNFSNRKFASQPFEEFHDVKIDTVEFSSEGANIDADENDISDTIKVLDADMQNILSYTEQVYQFIAGIENRFNILHGTREFLQNSLVHISFEVQKKTENVSFEVQKKTENALSFVALKMNEISDEFDFPRTSITIVAAMGELFENTMKKVSVMSEQKK